MQSTEPENWLPIVGYEGYYEVSDMGRVRSLDRMVAGRAVRGRMLRLSNGHAGHKQVDLCRNGMSRTSKVHQLVLTAFVGPMPDGLEGCHNDGDPSNNTRGNLRWDTRRENMRDRIRHGYRHKPNKTKCPREHDLVAPNLRASSLRRGQRSCLACDLEWKSASRQDREFDKARADERYAQITS